MLDVVCEPSHEVDFIFWRAPKGTFYPGASEAWVIDPTTSRLTKTPRLAAELMGCVIAFANHDGPDDLSGWKDFSWPLNNPIHTPPHWWACALRLSKSDSHEMVLSRDLAKQITTLISDLRHDGRTEGDYMSVRSS